MATAELPNRIEALEDVLGYLVMERQRLRSEGADRATLEANRLALVATQANLGRALADAHAARLQQRRAS